MLNYEEVTKAVEAGKKVHWANTGYTIIKDSKGQFLIQWRTGHCIGLPTPQMGDYYEKTFKDIFIGE